MTKGGLRVGSLFSGIGGFDLGLERAGMRTVWFCEQDEFCQRVLAKHWPGVPCYGDICNLDGRRVEPVDVLCGGFPCQDLSSAGKRAGLNGARSGLWYEYLRIIGELRPRYVLVENVPGLRQHLGVVTQGLAEVGYDAEWDVVSANDFGAPHLRKRLWLAAYPQRERLEGHRPVAGEPQIAESRNDRASLADAAWDLQTGTATTWAEWERTRESGSQSGTGAAIGNANGRGQPTLRVNDEASRMQGLGDARGGRESCGWEFEPDVGRVAHGVPARVDRLRSLGNALVPQIAEYIGHQIVAYEKAAAE